MITETKQRYNKKYYQENKKKFQVSGKKAMQKWRRRKGNREKEHEKAKKYRLEHRDEILFFERQTELKSHNGKKWTGLNKRPYLGFCEVCGREQKYKLNYHHWFDENPSLGIWLCITCHNMAHAVDKNLQLKYMELKQSILVGT